MSFLWKIVNGFMNVPQLSSGEVKRYCEVCKENVYKASSESEWQSYVDKGYCVSFVEGPKRIRKMGRVRR